MGARQADACRIQPRFQRLASLMRTNHGQGNGVRAMGFFGLKPAAPNAQESNRPTRNRAARRSRSTGAEDAAYEEERASCERVLACPARGGEAGSRPAKALRSADASSRPPRSKERVSSPEPLPCGGLVYPGPPAPNFRGDESCFFDLDCSQPIEKPRIGRRNPRKSKPVFLVRFGLALVRLGGTEVLRLRPFAPGAPLHASGRSPSPGTERDPPGELQSCVTPKVGVTRTGSE